MAGIFTINSDLDPAGTFVKQAIAEARENNKAINEAHRERLDDFYHNRQYKDNYLKNWGFKDADIPLYTINLTKKIIDKISLIYKYPPDREIKINKETNEAYANFITENGHLNIELKRAERLKNLFGNVLFRPMFYNGSWHFWIETEWIPQFLDGDPLTPIGYSIPVKRDTTITEANKIEDRQWYMYWSKDYYYWHDEDGNIKYDPEYPDGLNPFGMIPFIEMRKETPINEYWPEGAIDLVNGNMAINAALNDINYAIHFQSFNQPYGRGLTQEQANRIKIGANQFIGLSDIDMDLGMLSYSPQIAAAVDAIRAQIEMISQIYNVNIKWSLEGSAPSGFSLLVQNIDLLEAREDDLEYAKINERKIYKIIQAQDEKLNLGLKLPKLEKDTKLFIDFQEINFPINQKEELDRWDWEIEHNVKTPVDYIQSDQGLSEEDAQARYERNKALNEKLSIGQKLFRETLQQQGAVIEPASGNKE